MSAPWRDRLFLVSLKPPTPASLEAAAHRLKLSPRAVAALSARSVSAGEQVSLMSPGGDGDCCFTIEEIKTGRDLHTTEISGHRGYSATRALAVVPDGVAW